MTLTVLFVLLVAFEVKHFVADYPFQSAYHSGPERGYVPSILLHALFHGLLTAVVCTSYLALAQPAATRWVIGLALIDFTLHYAIDHHSLSMISKSKDHPAFWWMIGLDEMVHRFTNFYLVFLLSQIGG